MVFYIIGLGLGDVEDITVKGLNIVKKCSRVYLEAYTSILSYGLDKSRLEEFYGRSVIEADRNFVEEGCNEMLDRARHDDIAMLVVGDPFGATTHADLVLRAKEYNVDVRIVHNASIMNAVGCCGLQLYSFGATISIVFWTDDWQPSSYYDKIIANRRIGLHTLCLLDIKTKEQSIENLMRGRKIYEPACYMSCAVAAQQLLTIVERRRAGGYSKKEDETFEINETTDIVGLARVGWNDQKIVFCTIGEMTKVDMGPPLHAIIVPGRLHEMELTMLETFR